MDRAVLQRRVPGMFAALFTLGLLGSMIEFVSGKIER